MHIESFWEYSCRVYRQAGVSERCLHLQDEYALDVNLLLMCCWHAETRGVIDGATLTQMITQSQEWSNNVVNPLRGVRRWMKTQLMQEGASQGLASEQLIALREDIKKLELRTEQYQQAFLETMVARLPAEQNETQRLQAASRCFHELFLQQKRVVSDELIEASGDLIVAVVSHTALGHDQARAISMQSLRLA